MNETSQKAIDTREILAALQRRVELLGPCKEWTGARNNNGYGPHRRIYEDAHGPVPPGYDVCHLCYNRACVNPMHLTIATRAENMRMSCHRPKRGKLTKQQVQAVRDLLATGNYTQLEVAELLNLHGSTVAKIHIGMHYKDS